MTLTTHIETMRLILSHPGSRGRRAAALADYVRWNLGHRLLRADYVLPLVGEARITLSNRQNYATLAYVNRLWDFQEMMFLLHFLRPGEMFADIGANAGVYAILASAAAGCRAIAFEPVRATFRELQANIRLNGVEELVEAHHLGLGAEAGVLHMTAGLGGLNHVAVGQSRGPTEAVAVARLDDVLAGRPCAMMKLDAEGFERPILSGAQAALADPALAAIVVELNGSGARYGFADAEVDAELTRFGFRPMRYDPFGRTLAAQDGYDTGGLNTLYVRPSATVTERIAAAPAVMFRGRAV